VRETIRNPKDFWAGVIFLLVGVAAVGFGQNHPMGTAMRMGPAYFPTVLGMLLALIGLAAIVRSLVRPGPPVGRLALNKVALITTSIALFGLALRPLGFGPALLLLVLVSAYASRRFRWPVAATLAVGLAVFSVIAFVKLLGLPIAVFGSWLGG
jgi:putative tricarboxylic transport membrane protein